MLKYASLLILLSSGPVFADAPPTPDEMLAKDKVMIGQLYQALGQAEMQIADLKKQVKPAAAVVAPAASAPVVGH